MEVDSILESQMFYCQTDLKFNLSFCYFLGCEILMNISIFHLQFELIISTLRAGFPNINQLKKFKRPWESMHVMTLSDWSSSANKIIHVLSYHPNFLHWLQSNTLMHQPFPPLLWYAFLVPFCFFQNDNCFLLHISGHSPLSQGNTAHQNNISSEYHFQRIQDSAICH